ncbi:MAG: 4-hydroxy-3-methylbut-2-enyl diphosphate reductase [Thermoguttaceae bacterium]
MQIILVKPRGFCAGVNRAIASLQMVLKHYPPPIYVYHEIVHNTTVVQDFSRQGVLFVDSIAEVPDGATLLFSAHGVSPAICQEALARGITTINATCPLVERVHRDVVQLTRDGYKIALIGHRGHDEVVGVIGEAPENITLIESADDVDNLDFTPSARLAYVTQTTISVHDVEQITARLRKRFPSIVGQAAGSVCFATTNRQEAIQSLAHLADLVIVVGSRNSSNSRRLIEIAESCGVCAYLVDGPDDLWSGWFVGHETVLISSGASAPEHVVQQCVDVLQQRFHADVTERIVREEHVEFVLPRELTDAIPVQTHE